MNYSDIEPMTDYLRNPVCSNCEYFARNKLGNGACCHNPEYVPTFGSSSCEYFTLSTECSKALSKLSSFCDRYMNDINGTIINVLGNKWEIEVVKFKEHEYLKKHDAEGVTKQYLRKIIISDGTDKDLLNEEERLNRFKHCLRHEIIHAFLSESGLGACSNRNMKPWAKNEEMVDWIAFKSKDIFKVFDSLGLLE